MDLNNSIINFKRNYQDENAGSPSKKARLIPPPNLRTPYQLDSTQLALQLQNHPTMQNLGLSQNAAASLAQMAKKAHQCASTILYDVPVRQFKTVSCIIVPEKEQDPRIFLISDQVLGKGTFGVVKVVHQLDDTSARLAVKMPLYDKCGTEEEKKKFVDETLLTEAEILKQIYGQATHLEGIQPLPRQVFDLTSESHNPPRATKNQKVAKGVIMDRFDHDLWDEISGCLEDESPLTQKLIDRSSPRVGLTYVNICRQLFSGLATLAKKNRCHKDIKANNIGVKLPGEVFLIDWGASEDLGKLPESHCVTREFVLQVDRDHWHRIVDEKQHLADYQRLMKARDVFSLAVTLYRTLIGEHINPYSINPSGYGEGPIALDRKKLETNHVPNELVTLLEQCLSPDYLSRPTAHDVLTKLEQLQGTQQLPLKV